MLFRSARLDAPDGCAWVVSGAPEWLGLTPEAGAGSAELLVTAPANESTALRSAAIQIGSSSAAVIQLGVQPANTFPVSFLQQELVVPPVHGARLLELGSMVDPASAVVRGSEPWLKVRIVSPSAMISRVSIEWSNWNGDASRVAFAEINGSRLPVVQVPWAAGARASILAGQGLQQAPGPGGQIPLREPVALAIGQDGHLYIGEKETSRIIQARGDGEAGLWYGTHVWSTYNFSEGSTGVARGDESRLFNGAAGVAQGPSGSIYVLEAAASRVLRIGPDGSVAPVLHSGGLVTDRGTVFAGAMGLTSIASGPGGRLFAAARDLCRVWVIEPGVSAKVYAGTGVCGSSGDGGPAAEANIDRPAGIAVDFSGSLYIAEPNARRIRVVNAEGHISTFAGSGDAGHAPDGSAAKFSPLSGPSALASGPDGLIFFAEPDLGLVRFVTASGALGTVMLDGSPEIGRASCRERV